MGGRPAGSGRRKGLENLDDPGALFTEFERSTGISLGKPSNPTIDLMPDILDVDAWEGRDPLLNDILRDERVRNLILSLRAPWKPSEADLPEIEDLNRTQNEVEKGLKGLRRWAERTLRADSPKWGWLSEEDREKIKSVTRITTRRTGRPSSEEVTYRGFVIARLRMLKRADGQFLKPREVALLFALLCPTTERSYEVSSLTDLLRKTPQ